jgi:lantibiotic biosynthesis protein
MMKRRKSPGGVAGEGDSPYRAAALAIGRQLAAETVAAGCGVTWHGDDLTGESEDNVTVTHGPVGSGVYSGAAGIAWFLGHLGAHSDETGIAHAALAGLQYALADGKRALDRATLSLFTGAAGIALTALEVANRLGQTRLESRALSLARAVAKRVKEEQLPEETDLIGGIAGVVIGLLAIHQVAPDPLLLEACRVACDRLLHKKREEWLGFSWPDPHSPNGAPALCGMAHGGSGIGWALAEAARTTGEERFQSAASEAFLYERSWFSPERCAWPDLRKPSTSGEAPHWPGWTTAWCHGALGIGAVRLRMYELSQDLTALAEAGAAIHAARLLVSMAGSSLRVGHLSDVTLCHGLGGTAELMLLAYEITGIEDHLRAARRVGDLCLEIHRANQREWTCGLIGAKRVPGLFVGLAGIGATMLRLHDTSLIGSPLLPGRPPAPSRISGAPELT